MDDTEFELAILKIYEHDQNECNEKFGGLPMHYTISVDRCQKLFWTYYRVSRSQFLELFARFYEMQPKPLPNEIHCVSIYGGVSSHYRKTNWVEIRGKHYLQIRIVLSEYRRMRGNGQ